MEYKQLALAMLRTGLLGFGGGPSVMPLFRHEAVHTYKWMSDDDFGETLAIANTLPGPVATKMSAYLGYQLKGWPGAIWATIWHILPTSLAMILLFSVVGAVSNSAIIAGMIGAVTPVIAVLLAQMAYDFGKKAVKGFGWIMGIATFVLAFVLLQLVNLHPGIVIIVFIFYGLFHYRLVDKWRARSQGGTS
ncbi:chromate transport protein [Bacillus sp. JCM 19046]|uniref:Chromate transporter n=1 Tax=Shouchella xiaoxiensis TaxID=766895 RepID=A0ABS2SVV1_9BACI|nr:chromate transporter [Shouchella xiaoxiensis]GAF13479.1 chromate transport protein [Bacillus sp. JCM 19045]GAF17265.1 chromate transport protein [Bacillus sp. JCM 19046]